MAHPVGTRRARGWVCATALAAAFASWAMPAAAQEMPPAAAQQTPPPETREEQIELERLQKRVRLWPEREGGLVARANTALDRGLLEGFKSGRGPNGWQVRFTGTRSAQGQSFGIGYRRSDLFRDAVSARGAAAMTIHGAVRFDVEVRVNRFRRSEGTYLDVRGAYDRAPRMNFYGLGADSREEDRTVYLLQTYGGQVRAGYRFTKQFNAGFEVLGGRAHTGPGTNGDIPSIETRFDATTAPGLFDDTTFYWWGGFVGFDTRDLPSGPKRGGFYGVNLHRYDDVSRGKYSHRRLEIEGQQFFPYFNDTRVVAILVRSEFAYTGSDDRVVPFYLQPTLGGSIELRGTMHTASMTTTPSTPRLSIAVRLYRPRDGAVSRRGEDGV